MIFCCVILRKPLYLISAMWVIQQQSTYGIYIMIDSHTTKDFYFMYNSFIRISKFYVIMFIVGFPVIG